VVGSGCDWLPTQVLPGILLDGQVHLGEPDAPARNPESIYNDIARAGEMGYLEKISHFVTCPSIDFGALV
jgi:hypothetical protein